MKQKTGTRGRGAGRGRKRRGEARIRKSRLGDGHKGGTATSPRHAAVGLEATKQGQSEAVVHSLGQGSLSISLGAGAGAAAGRAGSFLWSHRAHPEWAWRKTPGQAHDPVITLGDGICEGTEQEMASRPGRFRCGSGFQAEGGKDREVEPPRLEGDEGRSGQAASLAGQVDSGGRGGLGARLCSACHRRGRAQEREWCSSGVRSTFGGHAWASGRDELGEEPGKGRENSQKCMRPA